jgi:hypothetical protein
MKKIERNYASTASQNIIKVRDYGGLAIEQVKLSFYYETYVRVV